MWVDVLTSQIWWWQEIGANSANATSKNWCQFADAARFWYEPGIHLKTDLPFVLHPASPETFARHQCTKSQCHTGPSSIGPWCLSVHGIIIAYMYYSRQNTSNMISRGQIAHAGIACVCHVEAIQNIRGIWRGNVGLFSPSSHPCFLKSGLGRIFAKRQLL